MGEGSERWKLWKVICQPFKIISPALFDAYWIDANVAAEDIATDRVIHRIDIQLIPRCRVLHEKAAKCFSLTCAVRSVFCAAYEIHFNGRRVDISDVGIGA